MTHTGIKQLCQDVCHQSLCLSTYLNRPATALLVWAESWSRSNYTIRRSTLDTQTIIRLSDYNPCQFSGLILAASSCSSLAPGGYPVRLNLGLHEGRVGHGVRCLGRFARQLLQHHSNLVLYFCLCFVFSGGKVVRLDFGQQELCSTLFLVVGKLFDLILGNRNYVRPDL